MPGSTAVRVVLFAWMAVPPLVFGYGWLLALNPNNGFVTHIVNGILGDWAPAISPFSMPALIFIAGERGDLVLYLRNQSADPPTIAVLGLASGPLVPPIR